MRMSLEEERRTLLEEIEARRSLYRRLLSGESEDHQITSNHSQIMRQAMSPRRKRLGQWLLDHPLQVAAGVALVVWLAPRLIRRHQHDPKTVAQVPGPNQRTGIFKAITGMMMLFLRDPRQLQTTASMVGSAWRWLRRALTVQTHTHGRKPYA
jgi:hypothetical protein